jgi:hypothetical protein
MSERKSREPAKRRRTVTSASSSPHLASLPLDHLRAYRRQLAAEEDRISYWRRLVHARLDLLAAKTESGGTLTMDQLVRVLGDTGSGRSRSTLLSIRPADPLPDLPVLAHMWAAEVDPEDHDGIIAAMDLLQAAEVQLTVYREALHRRIDEATSELISRYRVDPALALTALPVSS